MVLSITMRPMRYCVLGCERHRNFARVAMAPMPAAVTVPSLIVMRYSRSFISRKTQVSSRLMSRLRSARSSSMSPDLFAGSSLRLASMAGSAGKGHGGPMVAG